MLLTLAVVLPTPRLKAVTFKEGTVPSYEGSKKGQLCIPYKWHKEMLDDKFVITLMRTCKHDKRIEQLVQSHELL